MTAKVLAALALSGEKDLNDILSAKQITLFLSPLARMCISVSLTLTLTVSHSLLFPFPRRSGFFSSGELSSPIMRIINLTGSQGSLLLRLPLTYAPLPLCLSSFVACLLVAQ